MTQLIRAPCPATSAIDHDTDSVIQSSLRTELAPDVTVITVAHRLQTIMDADKIVRIPFVLLTYSESLIAPIDGP